MKTNKTRIEPSISRTLAPVYQESGRRPKTQRLRTREAGARVPRACADFDDALVDADAELLRHGLDDLRVDALANLGAATSRVNLNSSRSDTRHALCNRLTCARW